MAARRLVGSAYRRLGPASASSTGLRRWLLVIVVAGATLRFGWVLYAAREPRGFNDPALYEVFAARIADGHGYTYATGHATAYYPVGYPGVLGALVWLARLFPIPDNVPMTAALLNLVLGVGTIALTFEVGRRLFDNRIGLLSAAIVAFWPNLIFHTAVMLTETLFIFLVMGAVLVVVALPSSARRINWKRWAAFGVVLGLSALVRPISLTFVPVLFVVLLVARFGWLLSGWYVGIATLAVIIVLVPWTVRNVHATNSFVVISTNLGDNLCMSRHSGATGAFQASSACIVSRKMGATPAHEVEANSTNIRRAARFVRDHPLSEARLWFLRGYHTIENDHDGLRASESYGADPFVPPGLRRALDAVADVFFFAALILAVLAVPAFVRRGRPWHLFFLLAAAALAVQPVIFFGDPRFHVPVVPFIAVLAAVALRRARSLPLART